MKTKKGIEFLRFLVCVLAIVAAVSAEPFEIDVYCGTVPRRKPGRKKVEPRQFSVTTVQPLWKQTGEGDFTAGWDYCLPPRFWCYIRGLFDAWVICGRLTTCDNGAPIPGAVVSAFDVVETYVRVKDRWCYLYRAIDSAGATLASALSRSHEA